MRSEGPQHSLVDGAARHPVEPNSLRQRQESSGLRNGRRPRHTQEKSAAYLFAEMRYHLFCAAAIDCNGRGGARYLSFHMFQCTPCP